eukprot:Lithocolla_globosa_v1_NODE_142_length_5754_cov_77.335614.p8 type:complete len:103 gc:universal NODE_142_length_5754_cov_77.335614:3884-3576(-)
MAPRNGMASSLPPPTPPTPPTVDHTTLSPGKVDVDKFWRESIDNHLISKIISCKFLKDPPLDAKSTAPFVPSIMRAGPFLWNTEYRSKKQPTWPLKVTTLEI